MALKRKITKDEFEKLSEALQGEYKEVAGEYILDLTDYEDPAELRRARDREKEEAKQAKERLKELESEMDKLKDGDHKKKGDIDALEQSWQRKMGETEKQYQKRIEALESGIKESAKDSTVNAMASKLFKSPTLGKPHIRDRLSIELDDNGKPVTKVLDANGQPSAMTLEDLEKEFVGNKEFSSILIASKASGGAGGDGKQGGGGAPQQPSDDKVDLTKINPKDLASRFPVESDEQ